MIIYISSGFIRLDWSRFFSQHEEEDNDLKEEL
jgi:hypothetical protein